MLSDADDYRAHYVAADIIFSITACVNGVTTFSITVNVVAPFTQAFLEHIVSLSTVNVFKRFDICLLICVTQQCNCESKPGALS
jgi:hypothetical protein